jgi:hypothetical protein
MFVKNKSIYRLFLPLLVPAFIVGSRSSFALSLVGLLCYFLLLYKGIFNYIKLLSFLLFFILFIFFLPSIIEVLPPSGFKSSINYGLESFLLLTSHNGSESSSLNDFLSHKFIVLNNSFFEHLFGTGNFGRLQGQKILTDIGYALQYNGYGIIGTILCIFPFFYFILKIHSVDFRNYVLIFYIIVLFLNFKESILLSRGLFSFQIYLLVIGYYYRLFSKKIDFY